RRFDTPHLQRGGSAVNRCGSWRLCGQCQNLMVLERVSWTGANSTRAVTRRPDIAVALVGPALNCVAGPTRRRGHGRSSVVVVGLPKSLVATAPFPRTRCAFCGAAG